MKTDARDSVRRRICYVCGESVPERSRDPWNAMESPGVLHMGYRILVHRGVCAERVQAEERIYDRSAKGRWRPRREVLARLRAARPGEK